MVKQLISLTVLVCVGLATIPSVYAQQRSDGEELVDSTAQADAFEAYSDTTSTDDSTVVSRHHRIGGGITSAGGRGVSITTGGSVFDDLATTVGVEGIAGMFFVLCVLLIVFVFSPITIIALIFFFIYKNRRQKMRLAQTAVENGQPIPGELLSSSGVNGRDTYQTGIRQLFLGIGLMVFLGYTAGRIGFGVGALVFFIGLGKIVIAKTSKNQTEDIV